MNGPDIRPKQQRVHWADDMNSASSGKSLDEGSVSLDAVPDTLRGTLKKSLGRSNAKQWLLSQELETEGGIDMEWLRKLFETFTALRIEEGASRDKVQSELMLIGKVLTRGRKGPQPVDANDQEHKTEDGISLSTVLVATASEWFQWYTQHIIRSG
eukprot:CAMPEP_0179079944 /NCGR_PEP_ID=MMETSP0796-20121207/35901_1 /TAXON_ID=73915 /ORGANISM="Pyrodinium bahamense, Strain pbaha01" /LENGTH=155 /DNA_ID=CAMNT_0020777291 /DNA_START=73 /DNA_END=540 /DNA_ORIENTATION=-